MYQVFDTSSVTDMFGMFRYCESLISIDVSNFNISHVETMFDIFGYCFNLIYVNVSSFDTSKVKDFQGMFYSCNKLKYLDLSNFDISSATRIEYMFMSCEPLIYINLSSLKIRNSPIFTTIHNSDRSTIVCIKDSETINILKKQGMIFNCENKCFNENMKIDSKIINALKIVVDVNIKMNIIIYALKNVLT